MSPAFDSPEGRKQYRNLYQRVQVSGHASPPPVDLTASLTVTSGLLDRAGFEARMVRMLQHLRLPYKLTNQRGWFETRFQLDVSFESWREVQAFLDFDTWLLTNAGVQ